MGIQSLGGTPQRIGKYIGQPLAGYAKPKNMLAGGEIKGPGGPTDDKVPIAASNREYMLPEDSVAAIGGGSHAKGVQKLEKLRKATHTPVQKMADGGSPWDEDYKAGGQLSAVPNKRAPKLQDAGAVTPPTVVQVPWVERQPTITPYDESSWTHGMADGGKVGMIPTPLVDLARKVKPLPSELTPTQTDNPPAGSGEWPRYKGPRPKDVLREVPNREDDRPSGYYADGGAVEDQVSRNPALRKQELQDAEIGQYRRDPEYFGYEDRTPSGRVAVRKYFATEGEGKRETMPSAVGSGWETQWTPDAAKRAQKAGSDYANELYRETHGKVPLSRLADGGPVAGSMPLSGGKTRQQILDEQEAAAMGKPTMNVGKAPDTGTVQPVPQPPKKKGLLGLGFLGLADGGLVRYAKPKRYVQGIAEGGMPMTDEEWNRFVARQQEQPDAYKAPTVTAPSPTIVHPAVIGASVEPPKRQAREGLPLVKDIGRITPAPAVDYSGSTYTGPEPVAVPRPKVAIAPFPGSGYVQDQAQQSRREDAAGNTMKAAGIATRGVLTAPLVSLAESVGRVGQDIGNVVGPFASGLTGIEGFDSTPEVTPKPMASKAVAATQPSLVSAARTLYGNEGRGNGQPNVVVPQPNAYGPMDEFAFRDRIRGGATAGAPQGSGGIAGASITKDYGMGGPTVVATADKTGRFNSFSQGPAGSGTPAGSGGGMTTEEANAVARAKLDAMSAAEQQNRQQYMAWRDQQSLANSAAPQAWEIQNARLNYHGKGQFDDSALRARQLAAIIPQPAPDIVGQRARVQQAGDEALRTGLAATAQRQGTAQAAVMNPLAAEAQRQAIASGAQKIATETITLAEATQMHNLRGTVLDPKTSDKERATALQSLRALQGKYGKGELKVVGGGVDPQTMTTLPQHAVWVDENGNERWLQPPSSQSRATDGEVRVDPATGKRGKYDAKQGKWVPA